MAKRSIEIELDLQNREAQRRLKDTAKQLGDVEDALDDTESAGKRMARAIEAAADDMVDEIDATKRAVDALERALGDFDADPREVVADLKSIGLTAQDIEQDAEELADALKRSADVKVHAAQAGFDDLGQAVGSVREETGRAKDTMSGFIGGTVGELPGISEAMGPVGEGLGQLAEGALEGELNFKQLALAGGAMAGVAIILSKVQDHFRKINELKAWKKEQVEEYEDALEDAATAAEAVVKKLEDADELVIKLGGGFKDIDALPILNAAGVDVEQFSELVAGGTETINEYEDAMKASGIENDAWRGVVILARQEAEAFTQAQESAAVAAEFFGESTEDAEEAARELADATAEAKERQDELTASQIEGVSSAYDLEKANLDLADSVADFKDKQAETNEVLNDAEASADDKAQAIRDLRAEEIAMAETALETAAAYAREQGAQDGTIRSARLQLRRLEELQREYPEIASAVQPYIDNLRSIPGVVGTTVTANTAQAHGSVDSIERRLNSLRDRVWTAAVNVRSRIPGFAAGTNSAPGGMAVVGEQGPELVSLPQGANVRNAGQTSRLLDGAAPSRTNNYYVTNNFPAGVSERAVARATRRYEQVQGPL